MELAEKPPQRTSLGRILNGHDLGTFFKFIAVGGLAFVVNYAAFWLFYDSPLAGVMPDKDSHVDLLLFSHPDARLLLASVLSVQVAITFKFGVHEWWTFREHPADDWIVWRFVQFNVSAVLAAVIPLATINVLSTALGISPYISMLVGILIGFVINWAWSAHLIWQPRHDSPEASA